MVDRFISSLLLGNKNQQSWFYAKQVPQKIFNAHRAEISWIFAYREAKGRYPSVDNFKLRFPNFKLTKPALLPEALDAVQDSFFIQQIGRVVELTREKLEGGAPAKDVLEYFRQSAGNIASLDQSYVDVVQSLSSVPLDRYRARYKSAMEGGALFKPTPWPALNELLGFAEPGEHSLLASRTSLGKSWMALYWANYLSSMGDRVLVISKEMPSEQLADRAEALRFKLNYVLFRKAELAPRELRRWREERRNFKLTGELIFSGSESVRGSGFSQIHAKVQQYAPSVVIVDGAYLILPEDLHKNASSVERLTYVSQTMKRVCLAHKVRGISIVQVKREAESKSGEATSSLKDLYGTDAWAQDSDHVILLNGKRGSNRRIVDLVKGRESAIGAFNINFQLTPYPDFSQVTGVASDDVGASTFSV